jgi:hypothetical protein
MAQLGRGVITPLSSNADNLVSAVTSALDQITQTNSLVQTPGKYSPLVATISPSQYASSSAGSVLDYTVSLQWNGTAMPGPQIVSLSALFPLQGYYFDSNYINITLAPNVACGYCGDGFVNPPESCEPAVNGPCCSLQCTFNTNVTCGNTTSIDITPVTTPWVGMIACDYHAPTGM